MDSGIFNSGSYIAQSNAVMHKESEYPDFAKLMDKWGYDWEAFKVHTEDRYIISTFHILG